MDWLTHYMNGANWVKQKSKDPHTKVGCIIVGPDHEIRSSGYNGLPRGCNDSIIAYPERHDRVKDKYSWYAHAEENAIANAARMGTPLKGCAAFITALPCANCSRILIGAGIADVFWSMDPSFVSTPERAATFEKSLKLSVTMLREAGVTVIKLSSVDDVWRIDAGRNHPTSR